MATRQVSVTKTTPVLLWKTTSGTTPDPPVTLAAGTFRAGTPSDPLPITIENLTATHTVWIGQGSGASAITKTSGEALLGHGSKTFSVAGNDDVYAIATTATVKVSVSVGRQ